MHKLVLILASLALVQCASMGPTPDFSSSRHGQGYREDYDDGDSSSPRRRAVVREEEMEERHLARSRSNSSRREVEPSNDDGWIGRESSRSAERRSSGYPLDGVVTESYSGNRTHRDKHSGEIVGSEWTSPAGTTTYRDSDGRIKGSSSESSTGNRTYRDDNGSIKMNSSTTQGTGGDNTTTYRRNGSIVGTKYVSPAGNVTWRNGDGEIISGPSEMKP